VHTENKENRLELLWI